MNVAKELVTYSKDANEKFLKYHVKLDLTASFNHVIKETKVLTHNQLKNNIHHPGKMNEMKNNKNDEEYISHIKYQKDRFNNHIQSTNGPNSKVGRSGTLQGSPCNFQNTTNDEPNASGASIE